MNIFESIQGSEIRPDRDRYGKGKEYHKQYARYCVQNAFTDQRHNTWIAWCNVNRNFWVGNQWIVQEDLEAFFKDSSGQNRNRIKVVKNFIWSIIEQYRGNAEAMDLTIRAKSRSIKAINRREERLAEVTFYDQLARDLEGGAEEISGFIKDNFNIGRTQQDTIQTASNLYVDEYVESINALCDGIGYENQFKSKQAELGFDLALTGLPVIKYCVDKGEMYWKRIVPEYFFWDRSASEYDLTDSEYMGDYTYYTPQGIFERWQKLSEEDRKCIKDRASYQGEQWDKKDRIPVYTVYWKDYEKYEYGYVMDEDQYPYLARINYKYPGEDKPRYKKADLIKLKDLNEEQKKILKGKNSAKLYVDVVRYAVLIPKEAMAKGDDFILEYGVMPYQDTEYEELNSAKFPYKTYAWAYFEGSVATPISQLINPQRMVNRFASVMENQINNTHGKSLFIDRDAVEPGEEENIMNDLYQNKPVLLNGRRAGVHNMVGEAGSTIDSGITVYDTLEQVMKRDMESIVGVNEAMKGQSTGPDQLVGVTALQIQRASLIQEPFYKALTEVYKQAHNTNANVGRRVYIDNPRKLAILVGDIKASILTNSRQYDTEDFRVEIHREVNYEQQIQAGNQKLEMWFQAQIINKEQFAEMYNRTTPEELSIALRKFVNEEIEAQKVMAEQQQMAQMQVAEQEQAMTQEQMNAMEQQRIDKLAENQRDRDHETNKEFIKAVAKQPVATQ